MYEVLAFNPKIGLARKYWPLVITLVTWKAWDVPSGLPEVLTPAFTHAAGKLLMMLHPVKPEEKSPLGMRFCAGGVTVTVVVVVAVVVTVVETVVVMVAVVVEMPSASSVAMVCHAVAVT
jgi:hypothetical protein